MSAPVDVLAVLKEFDETCAVLTQECVRHGRFGEAQAWTDTANTASQARSAVAELIEADRAYDKASRAWDDGRFSDWEGISDESRMKVAEAFEEAAVRRADALARVGGAS